MEPVIQAADLEKDCTSFTVCVAIGMFVLGVWGITLPSFYFFSGTGLLFEHNYFALFVDFAGWVAATPMLCSCCCVASPTSWLCSLRLIWVYTVFITCLPTLSSSVVLIMIIIIIIMGT